jgi:purine-binding chemotaxis protein CheW
MAEKIPRSIVDDDLLEEDEDTQKDKFLTFCLGNEDYGIPIQFVTEIVGIQKITLVPDMMEFVKGVINLRGNVIPVIDVRARFQMGPREYDDRTCVVVVHLKEMAVGLVVDTVKEVVTMPPEQISPPPKFQKPQGGKFLQGMGKLGDQVKILLDVEKLLQEEELAQLESLTKLAK